VKLSSVLRTFWGDAQYTTSEPFAASSLTWNQVGQRNSLYLLLLALSPIHESWNTDTGAVMLQDANCILRPCPARRNRELEIAWPTGFRGKKTSQHRITARIDPPRAPRFSMPAAN
jgi:hypothetical protein